MTGQAGVYHHADGTTDFLSDGGRYAIRISGDGTESLLHLSQDALVEDGPQWITVRLPDRPGNMMFRKDTGLVLSGDRGSAALWPLIWKALQDPARTPVAIDWAGAR